MDPIVIPIVLVLGKYALDKGLELGKEIGPKALDKAREMFGMVLDRLRTKPDTKLVADEYEKDPETYQKPLEKKLDEALKDPEFSKMLKELYETFQREAQAHDAVAATRYTANLKGSGAIAQGTNARADGAGGVMVGGNVEGGVNTRKPRKDEDGQ